MKGAPGKLKNGVRIIFEENKSDAIAVVVILLLAALSISCWRYYYPLYFDAYDIANHLAIARGYQRIGGLTFLNFWEFPPGGEHHYYPPLAHIIAAFFLGQGCPADTLAKWGSWLLYPLSLLSAWLFSRFTFGPTAGLYSLTLLGIPWIWVEKIWGSPSNGLFLVILPLALLALVKKKYLAAAFLTLLCLLTHLLSLILPFIILIYLLHQPNKRRVIPFLFIFLFIFSLPFIGLGIWRLNQYSSLIPDLHWRGIGGVMQIFGPGNFAYLGLLGFLGLLLSYRYKGEYLILPSLFFAAFPLFIMGYGFRFLFPNAVLLLALSGGVVVARVDRLLLRKLGKEGALAQFFSSFIIVPALIFIFPLTNKLPGKMHWPALLVFKNPSLWEPYNLVIAHQDKIRMAQIVRDNCLENEFVYMQASLNVNRAISAFSGRSVSGREREGARIYIVREPLPGKQYLDKVGDYYIYKESNRGNLRLVAMPKPVLPLKWLQQK